MSELNDKKLIKPKKELTEAELPSSAIMEFEVCEGCELTIYDIYKWTLEGLNGIDTRITYEASDESLAREVCYMRENAPIGDIIYANYEEWLRGYLDNENEDIANNAHIIYDTIQNWIKWFENIDNYDNKSLNMAIEEDNP